jgi:ADP-ribosyltransferase exoenzyme
LDEFNHVLSCAEEGFTLFRSSLNHDEHQAINGWLGLYYEDICVYQRTGEGDERVIKVEKNLNSALSKAVICHHAVYRGLSDKCFCPDRQQYIRELINGNETFVLDSHASASVVKEIAKGFTFTDPDDDDRTLSLLLQISSRTGRYLKPFQHKAGDEGEVVLLRGSKYRRIFAKRQADPKINHEYWIMQAEEII